jgi:hypothetical protein
LTAPAQAADEAYWYFESLSADGQRALLREIDPSKSHSMFHVRVVEVDSGNVVSEESLPELAKVPAATIGGEPTELAALEWMLASPAFGRDIVRGSQIANGFPFGACGRLSAGKSGISFDAGDWLYVADEAGRVRKRIVDDAAYDPRFTPDGRHLLFRRATGNVGVFAKYELFVVPADLSQAPRPIFGTVGMHDRLVEHPDGQSAFAVATDRAHGPTCVVSLSMKSFAAHRLGCIDGSEQLGVSVISPKGKWAALSTKKHASDGKVDWRLRVMSLGSGKVVYDEPEPPGLTVRAISDAGLMVQSGIVGTVVTDVPTKRWRELDPAIELSRGFFRNDNEFVYANDGTVAVIDVAKK